MLVQCYKSVIVDRGYKPTVNYGCRTEIGI